MENWVRTDEMEDVAGSIRHVIRTADFVTQDPQAWKWIVLALHSALQGACVCHLTTTATPVGAVTERNAVEWLNYFEKISADRKAKPPKTYLMGFSDLLKSVRKPHSAGDRSNAVGVTISDSELSWLVNFHNGIRNQFTHFEPVGWSIEMSVIPEIAKLTARIVEDIVDIGWGFRHQSSEQRDNMRRNLRTLAEMEWPS